MCWNNFFNYLYKQKTLIHSLKKGFLFGRKVAVQFCWVGLECLRAFRRKLSPLAWNPLRNQGFILGPGSHARWKMLNNNAQFFPEDIDIWIFKLEPAREKTLPPFQPPSTGSPSILELILRFYYTVYSSQSWSSPHSARLTDLYPPSRSLRSADQLRLYTPELKTSVTAPLIWQNDPHTHPQNCIQRPIFTSWRLTLYW